MDTACETHAEREQEVLPRLHAAEQTRYQSFTHPRRRQTWLAGRALLLAALTRQLGRIEPDALRSDPAGGVHYRDDTPHLSLSHSRDLIAAAMAPVPIGVDIEWPRSRAALRQFTRLFADDETARLQALPPAERQRAFYDLWTLKEAAGKAAGVPLLESLRCARFDLDNKIFSLEAPFPSGGWGFLSARLEPDWHLALAANNQGEALRVECWRLSAPDQWIAQPLARQVFLRGP